MKSLEERLDNLYDKMIDESPFNFKLGHKPYIKELAKLYSLECQKELQKRIVENACNCLELYNFEYKLLEESITDEKLLVT